MPISTSMLWELVRNQHNGLVKSNGIVLSKEKGNLTNKHTPISCAYANNKNVSVERVGEKVVIKTNAVTNQYKPNKNVKSYEYVAKKGCAVKISKKSGNLAKNIRKNLARAAHKRACKLAKF